MNPVVKNYLQHARAMFPILGKAERQYLKKFRDCVQSFAEERPYLTQEDLIQQFGPAEEVFSLYLSECDSDYLVRRIQVAKWVHVAAMAFLVALLLAVVTLSIYLHKTYKVFESQKAVSIEECVE